MQLINFPDPDRFPSIKTAIHTERLNRYITRTGQPHETALKYYLWNCVLCETFHLSLHFAEVACRNALHNGLLRRCGHCWYEDPLLHKLLDERFLSELRDAIEYERKQHGDNVTAHHIVSALTFGFWEHLTTKRFERFLWAKGIQNIFPHAPKNMTLNQVHDLIESVRRWRNRIAHHRAIFDRGPMKKHQEALDLIALVCSDTSAWVASSSKVPLAIGLKAQVISN